MRYLGLLILVGCAPVTPEGEAAAPLGQSLDAADRDCRIVLRAVDGPLVDFDVATALNAPASLLYRAEGGSWAASDGLAIAGAPGRFQRYRVRLPEAQEVELIPFAATAGGRLFDHNRNSENYRVTAPFSRSDDGVCLERGQPRAVLEFKAGYTTLQHGALSRGGRVSINYDLSRLTTCRATHNGYRFWSMDASIQFQPGGQLATGTVVGSNGPSSYPVAFEADIPDDAESAQLWFHNYTPGECDAWDSNYGHNHPFPVVAQPASIGWVGDWGSSFSRECAHQAGVPEPAVIDEYVRERACSFVDEDVWVPGAEDHPEWIQAQVEWQKDGQALVQSWLDPVGRVGNNSRFRWSLPYEIRNQSDWSTVSYRFRFTSDGNRWLDGGALRTLQRAP